MDNTNSGFIVDVTFSSTTKAKAKALIINLFAQYSIDDEVDTYGIDYKKSIETGAFERCAIRFKEEKGKLTIKYAQSFREDPILMILINSCRRFC